MEVDPSKRSKMKRQAFAIGDLLPVFAEKLLHHNLTMSYPPNKWVVNQNG